MKREEIIQAAKEHLQHHGDTVSTMIIETDLTNSELGSTFRTVKALTVGLDEKQGFEVAITIYSQVLNDQNPTLYLQQRLVSELADFVCSKNFESVKKSLEDEDGYVEGAVMLPIGEISFFISTEENLQGELGHDSTKKKLAMIFNETTQVYDQCEFKKAVVVIYGFKIQPTANISTNSSAMVSHALH